MNENIKNAYKLNNSHSQSGFTLMEAMLAFSVICTIFAFFPLVMNVFYEKKSDGLNQKEVELFLNQAGKEIREAKALNETWRKLEMINRNGETVTYERYGALIRRQVNGMGHEVMLQNVEGFSFSVSGEQVEISISGKDGNRLKRVFSSRNTVLLQ
ncbi:competence type IV pilus minor pilin ComGF [Bacillus taeanensis]|uniref:Prepilin-type N-terminal cleavage/methylation domain-containing protein n=1 Tax=Bacillus taeanensis TaxID=273032 RepID=A0A366XW04_9BACI|nr:competence type IV pilus minor pilin ComGF [Bacillus taeanensis]RBW70580.1 hypothetical protein DS031_06065 [Bacillus taeanensis]